MASDLFAVFVVARAGSGIAATTRAADRGEAGRIGLPGGKVDAGESPVAAAIREAAEEGWDVSLPADATPTIVKQVEGKPVGWYVSTQPAIQLDKFKEHGRIVPVVATRAQVVASGYGNEWLAEFPEFDAVA